MTARVTRLAALALFLAFASSCTFGVYEATYDLAPGEPQPIAEAPERIESQSTASAVALLKVLPLGELIEAFKRLFTGQGETDRATIKQGAIASRTRKLLWFSTD